MNTKLTIVAFTCLLSCAHLLAQQKQKTDTASKEISQNAFPHWKMGDVKLFVINHSTEKTENGKPVISNLTYYANVVLLDSSAEGYRLGWYYVRPPSYAKSPGGIEMWELYRGTGIELTTSDKGILTDIVNWKDLRDIYFKLVEASIPKKKDGSSDSAMQKVKQLFSSKQMVMTAMAKEVMLFFQVYGKTYTTKGSTVNTELPNPFIPVRTIPALLSIKISEVNRKLNYYKIVMTQNVDKEGMSEMFNGMFDKMDIQGKDSSIAAAKKMLSNFEMNDYIEYRINASTGWVTRMVYKRTVTSAMFSQKDAYVIEEDKF